MPSYQRYPTNYPGVYYIIGISRSTAKPEKIYYISYWKNGKKYEEKAGREFKDGMTPAQANRIRAARMDNKELSNREQRERREAERLRKQNRWTIDRLWQEYKYRRPDVKAIRRDDNRYKKYVLPLFGNKEPHELSQFSIDKMRVTLLKEKSPQTVKLILALLKRIINFGVKKQLCEPLSFHIELPRVDNIKTEDLSSEQLQRLLKAIEADKNIQVSNLMKLALFTGMRAGELFKLQWSDLDFKKGFIHIRDPKSGVSQPIPMNSLARQVLKSHPQTGSPYVFPGRNGKQRVEIHIQTRRIKDRAGLPKDFRPLHGLRHVYASMLASSGQVDLYTLQKLLTHKIPLKTQRYAHLRDETLKKASNLLGDLITEAVSDDTAEPKINLVANKIHSPSR